jgi:hypothetical protein
LTDENIQPLFNWLNSLKNAAPNCAAENYIRSSYQIEQALAAADEATVALWLTLTGSGDNCDHAALSDALSNAAYDYFRFQHARYDGDLAGTEVGMVLFYTDLLAKLWAIDYQYSSPGADISDFVSLPETHLAHVFDAEAVEKSSTRLWFGHQFDGFQSADNGNSLLFGSVATRIYAASSSLLFPGVESEPSAQSGAFLGWWDNHYAEVAQFEPQYERLNEIMKWSIVFAWLSNKDQLDATVFLKSAPVNRSNWFPDWAKAHPELRFKDWGSIQFYDRGYRGLQVETLPILSTPDQRPDGSDWTGSVWSGGVSLPDPFIFENLASLPSVEIEDSLGLVLRSDLDYSSVSAFSGAPEAFTTLGGTHYEFSTLADAVTVDSVAATSAKLRDAYAETINAAVDRSLRSDISGMQIDVSVADVPVGHLDIRPSGNGFAIGYEGLTLDQTHQLGRTLSTYSSAAWGDVLRNTPNVEDAIQTGNSVAVRFKGDQDRWVEFSFEPPSVDIPQDVYMRISADSPGARGLDARVFTTEEIRSQFANGKTLKGTLNDSASGIPDEVPVFDNPLLDQMSSGNYDGLASLLLGSPDQAANLLAFKTEALHHVGDLLAHGHQVEALQDLSMLRKMFGDQPDLVALDALTKANLSRLQLAADAVNTSAIPEGSRLTLNDELIARLRATASPEQHVNLARILQATADKASGRTTLYPDGNVLNLEYHVDTLTQGETVAFEAIPPDAPVYIADNFNLTTADPSLSVRQVLSQPDFGADARAFRFSNDEAGAMRPGRVFEESSQRTYQLVDFDETAASSEESRKLVDFLKDLTEQLLDAALDADGGDSSCPAGQTANSDGSCSCPDGSTLVANVCVSRTDVYVIVSSK